MFFLRVLFMSKVCQKLADIRTSSGRALEESTIHLHEENNILGKQIGRKSRLLAERFERPSISPYNLFPVEWSTVFNSLVVMLTFLIVLLQFKVAEFNNDF